MTQEVKTVIKISHKPSMIDKPDKQTLNGDINSQWSMIINTNTSFFFNECAYLDHQEKKTIMRKYGMTKLSTIIDEQVNPHP